jgi:hypothetical protein
MNKIILIVHPKDNTTTFLNSVYSNIANKTLIQDGLLKRINPFIEIP